MNTINITGRICADPELKTTQSGISLCVYNLAVKRPKVKDTTDFLPVVSWRQGAEYLCKYGHKGDMVAVSGVLTARSWEDKDGNKRISYEIVTDTVELVGGTRSESTNANITPMPTQPQQTQQQEFVVISDEDLPF